MEYITHLGLVSASQIDNDRVLLLLAHWQPCHIGGLPSPGTLQSCGTGLLAVTPLPQATHTDRHGYPGEQLHMSHSLVRERSTSLFGFWF